MTKQTEVQDKINDVVRDLISAGCTDAEIVSTLTDDIKDIKDIKQQWGKPWLDAMQATRARIMREGSKGLLHN